LNNIFLFPGQGAQSVGMGKDLAGRYELARQRYAEAREILGFDLGAICFEGPEDELRQTRVTQPALYVHSCILTDLLKESGVHASAAAGHSVGEYAALYCGGVFSFHEGLRLVKARAESMQYAGEVNPGTMAAIVGLADEDIREVCSAASREGVVVPANYNSPGQLVISGSVPAVRKAIEIARTRGAKLAKELSVSGAFHSPLMKPAADALARALTSAHLSKPVLPVIANVTAKPHETAETVRRLLAEQLLSPVRWTESLLEMAQIENIRWLEVGSGSVLAGLLKRTIKGATATTIGSAKDLDDATQLAVVVS
jgi:[acyl-carrier-protein] S-malonyltransferase